MLKILLEYWQDSVNPKDYIKKLRKRDSEFSEGWGQIVTPPLKMQTAGGMQKVNCADVEGIFRIPSGFFCNDERYKWWNSYRRARNSIHRSSW